MDTGELEPRRRVLLVYLVHSVDGQQVEIEDVLVLHERAYFEAASEGHIRSSGGDDRHGCC